MFQTFSDGRVRGLPLGAGARPVLAAAIACALGVAVPSAPTRAQPAAPSASAGLDEVIVTARRREESVQEVPLSIVVLDGDALTNQGVLRPSELQFAVPGFYVQNYETRATIAMRGVGAQVAGSTSAVAAHVNGIYQASSAAQLNRLFDIQRVEVLKGPQGTLYGRNSTGGALNVITRAPGREFAADVSTSYGSYDTVRADAGMTIPVGDRFGVRIAGSYAKGDGQFTNVVTGQKVGNDDFKGGRLSVGGDAGPVKVEFFVQYTEDNDTSGITLIPLVVGDDVPLLGWDKTALDNPTENVIERESFLTGLTLSGQVGNYTWRSITGYLDYDEPTSVLDVNPRPSIPNQQVISFPQAAKQFSQELQLLYAADRMNWVLGAYYLDDQQTALRNVKLLPANRTLLNSRSENDVEALALFGDLTYKLTDQLNLNVGARWNDEDVHNRFEANGLFDGAPFDLSGSQGDPTGRIGLDYTIQPGLMVYGTVSTGYQSGSFQTKFDAVTGDDTPYEVKPEELLAFETGVKSVLPGERGFLNAAAFYYDYKDMQVQVGGLFLLPNGLPDPTQPPFFYTDNAGKAEIYGVDLELTELRVAEHLKFDLSAAYLHATYKDYDSVNSQRQPVSYDGNYLPRAPKFSATTAASFDQLRLGASAEAGIRLEYNYRSKTYFQPDNRPTAVQEAFGLVNLYAFVDFADARWRVFASGRNLTDEEFFDFHRGDTFANTGEFRTWEVGARYTFR
jgi:iron complex outermembrane receptor protein